MWAVCQIQAHLGRTAAWFHFITAVMIKISCNVVHLRIFHAVIIFPRPPHTVLPPFYRKHKVNFQDKKWMQKLCWIKRINYPPSHRKMFYSYGYFTSPLKSLNKQIVNITSSINKQKQPRGDFKYIVSILLNTWGVDYGGTAKQQISETEWKPPTNQRHALWKSAVTLYTYSQTCDR